jgi:predicted phosphodiesterase
VILASLRYGASNRAIARDLAVDEKTIRRFRASLDVTEKHGREETLGQSHLSNNAVKRFIAVSDIHWPYVHKPTIKLILSLLGDIQFDGFVFLGDQFDNSVISHHNKGKNLLKPRGSYYAEETSFDKEFLRPVEQLIGDGKKIWIKGNHDHWETQYVEEFPELEGKIERDISLKLEERGWEVVECGKSYTYGKLTYLHGETLTGAQHAKKALEVFCTNVLYGHFHSPQSATKVLPHNQTQKWSAWCSPIAGDCNPYYMRNKPSGWVNGFTLIEYTRNGNFNLYPIITSGNEIAYGGKIYKA